MPQKSARRKVAKIAKGDAIFAALPQYYLSSFPSDASLVEGQLSTLLTRVTAAKPGLLAQAQAESITSGLQLVQQAKATVAGDFLISMMPKLVSFKTGVGGQPLVQGLFGSVSFPTSLSEDAIRDAMIQSGLNVALTAISAIPIVGKFAGLFVNLGMALADLLGANDVSVALPPLLVPWAKYSKASDEDLVNLFLVKLYGQGVDWTDIWRPALKGEWRYERASDEQGQEMPGARVFAPLDKHNEVGWTGVGLGAVPNTMRQAAPVQTIEDTRLRDLAYAGFADAKSEWERRKRYALNSDRQYVELPYPPRIIDTGSFKPAFAGIAGQLWQQVADRGNPDMFKVRPSVIRDEWQQYWGAFFEGGFAALKKAIKDGDREATWVWAALSPYVCMVQANGKKILLGMPNLNRPHGGILVTPDIFKPGHGPATLATRTGSLYLEAMDGDTVEQVEGQFLKNNQAVDMAVLDHGPPWTTKVLQDALLDFPPVYKGFKLAAVPWPNGEELLSYYQPPDVAITTPACDALALAQRRSLERTLVCAYVRPLATPAGPAYGAFADEKLRKDCLDLRELLLTHPARFEVNLTDATAIDPDFALRLRKAGVTMEGIKPQLAAKPAPPLVDTGEQLPPPPPPADGLPFDQTLLNDRPRRRGRDDDSSALPWLLSGVTIVAGGAAAAYLARRRVRAPRRYNHAR